MPQAVTAEPTALYRLYDAEHDLLYIGISREPEGRFKAHAHNKNWWHCVKYADLTWFPSYPAAKRAESAAHISERPPYNGMGHTGLGWDIPALRYDDSAERADARRRILDALDAGKYPPGTRLWPFHIAQSYGCSRSTAYDVLVDLTREGRLKSLISTFATHEMSGESSTKAA